MITFFAILKASVPPFVGFLAAVGLEQTLYRLDRIFMPLWRPAMLFIVALVARVTWICWQAMSPMDSLLTYGGPDSTNLLVSIVAFTMVIAALTIWLAWGGVKLIMRDWNAGQLEKSISSLRFAVLGIGAFMCAAFLLGLYCSPITEGKSLWAVLCGD